MDSFADEGLTNAQMINAREIVSRLDPDRFSVTMFVRGVAAPEILARREYSPDSSSKPAANDSVARAIPVRRSGHSVLSEGVPRQSMVFEDAIASK